jgi:hypothetical protein
MQCHKALLLRLFDEINSNYLGRPDVEFRYYSLIRGGPDLPPEEEWSGWPRVISDIFRRNRPIESGGWVTIPNSKRVAYQLYFYGFGRDPDLSAFRRFEDQAGRLVQLSRGCLAEAGIDYKIQDHSHNGWMHLCLLLAWDHPDSVTYGITHFTLDDFNDTCPYPVGDREQFEAWKRGEIDLPEGYHFIGLSRDIRICSLEAIRLILDLAEKSAQRESNNRLMIYPARLGTEPSPTAPPQNFPAEDGGKANELSRTDIPAIRPPDPALPKDEENPNLHVIFPGRLTSFPHIPG